MAKNSSINSLNYTIRIIIALFITPYIISKLGMELFGLWALLGIIPSYAFLSDLGISRSVVKFVAEYIGRRDEKGLYEIVNTAFILYLILGLAGFFLFFYLRETIIKILNVPSNLHNVAIFVYVALIAIFYLNFIFSIFKAILNGLQRLYITSSIATFSNLIFALGAFYVLEKGYKLKGLVIVNGISVIITISLYYIFSRRYLPNCRFNVKLFKKEKVKEIFKFGVHVEASYIFRLFYDPINKILLSNYASLELVGVYEIALKILRWSQILFRKSIEPLLPAGSRYYQERKKEEFVRFYLFSIRYITLMFLPVCLIIFFFSESFIFLWVGKGFMLSVFMLQLLIFAYFLEIMATPSFILIQSMNLPKYSMFATLIRGILNAGLGLILIRFFSYKGLIFSIFISIIFSSLFIIRIFHKKVSLNIKDFMTFLSLRFLYIFILSASFMFILANLYKPNNLIILILMAILFLLFYMFLILKLKFFRSEDVEIIKRILPHKFHNFIDRFIFV